LAGGAFFCGCGGIDTNGGFREAVWVDWATFMALTRALLKGAFRGGADGRG
jgi:hypothetical protein